MSFFQGIRILYYVFPMLNKFVWISFLNKVDILDDLLGHAEEEPGSLEKGDVALEWVIAPTSLKGREDSIYFYNHGIAFCAWIINYGTFKIFITNSPHANVILCIFWRHSFIYNIMYFLQLVPCKDFFFYFYERWKYVIPL